MKVLFAVSNDKMSEMIVKQYQKDYKQIISYKNVYYFNAILKELQRDKTYDRVVISEDLEQYVNADYEQMDRFMFDKLDSISDEASNNKGEDVPIILICMERRTKSEPILVRLFGIGIYNAIIGNDRSVNEVCRLINRPRSKKEAKIYYKIDSDDVSYEKDNENDVSELEIQNILAHYKKLGNNEEKYVESFESIASQYNTAQLKVISQCLPLNVRAVLEEKSLKYQQVNSFNSKVSDDLRIKNKKVEKKGTSEILLKGTTPKMSEPVVVPSSIDSSKKRKILHNIEEEIQSKQTITEEEDIPEIEEFEDIPEIDLTELNEDLSNNIIEEEVFIEQPVKRGRGRPRKKVEELTEQAPKRGRGRPKKVVDTEEIIENEVEEEVILPGFEEEPEENLLPGFEEENDSFEQEEETILPEFEEHKDLEEDDEGSFLPGFEDIEEEESDDTQNTSLINLPEVENLFGRKETQFKEISMEDLLYPNKKLVAFVGTSKNGTSFLVNNVAELLASNGVDTAVLDLTQNRNAYYIYTKNEDELREKSNYTMSNLRAGKANGISESKNLTIYTSSIENDENLEDVESIIETLLKNHTVVLMDCDFTTPMRYFKYAQELYLVQSMDILTIQPLTVFLRKLSDKNILDASKVRVVLNKFIRTREINEHLLIGGISIYNDAGMTVRKELFDRKNVQYITIPFDFKTYLRYLDGLVVCDVSLKGYTKEFIQSLKQLADMVYKTGKKSEKYMPPSVKKNNTFSQSTNRTLDQMKKNY